MGHVISDLEAREQAAATPLDAISIADPQLFRSGAAPAYLERLRREDPVHWADAGGAIGGYWSITKYSDIVEVETNHEVFSSASGIVLEQPGGDDYVPSAFIEMDPPQHSAHRKTVAPAVSAHSIAELSSVIRERAAGILDDLPIGEAFDWVDKVSIELTTMTLATLFDFPWEDRRKLTRWSDVAFAPPGSDLFSSTDPEIAAREQEAEMAECVEYFSRLWAERVNGDGSDFISLLARGENTRDMTPHQLMGTLILLIVGGNDTTRNSVSGSVLALNQFPGQDRLMRQNPDLIPAMVSESIRWQTPIAYFRRTARQDYTLRGKTIRKGDKLALWYTSGNRDDDEIERPNDYWIERPNVRQHLSFGFGIHRCLGNRLAELQLKIVWEEILKRFPRIEVVGPAERTYSCFINGYEHLPVLIPKRN